MVPRSVRSKWFFCVSLSVMPLVFFLILFEFFAIGDQTFSAVWADRQVPADLLIAHSAERMRIGVIGYGSYLLVHIPICLAACAYYFLCLKRQRPLISREEGAEIGYATAFALLVCFAIWFLLVLDTPLSKLVIAPFQTFPTPPGLSNGFEPIAKEKSTFLRWAILIPTLPGVIAVVFASAAFHQTVILRRYVQARGDGRTPMNPVPVLRVQLMALSAVLVSSVLTARAYFHIFPDLINPEEKAVHQLLADLASVLTTATGLLYTLTLIMAFAPGVIIIVNRVVLMPTGADDSKLFKEAFDQFRIGNWYAQFKSVLQVVLTVVAPALASPLLAVIAG